MGPTAGRDIGRGRAKATVEAHPSDAPRWAAATTTATQPARQPLATLRVAPPVVALAPSDDDAWQSQFAKSKSKPKTEALLSAGAVILQRRTHTHKSKQRPQLSPSAGGPKPVHRRQQHYGTPVTKIRHAAARQKESHVTGQRQAAIGTSSLYDTVERNQRPQQAVRPRPGVAAVPQRPRRLQAAVRSATLGSRSKVRRRGTTRHGATHGQPTCERGGNCDDRTRLPGTVEPRPLGGGVARHNGEAWLTC